MAKEPARRADARENRERILAVAREAFRSSNDVSMHALAKLAGVGQGTLYRNFPNRDTLVLALHRQDVDILVASADEHLKQLAPAHALHEWILCLAAFGRANDGLSEVLRGFTCEQLRAEGFQAVVDMLATVLTRAQASGEVRPDIDVEDLLALVGFIWSKSEDPQRVQRLLNIIIKSISVDN